MKYIITLLGLCIASQAFSQKIDFEDPSFEKIVLEKYPDTDLNSNGKIERNEAERVKELDLMDLNITNANDVKFFKGLRYLSLTSNGIEKFSISNFQYLEELYITDNKLKEFTISNMPALKELACGRNRLQKATVNNCPNIESLYTMDNEIRELDLSPFKKLKYLTTDNNKLKKLDLSANPELIQISIKDNDIDSIDITKNQKLVMHILYIDPDVKITGTQEQMKKYQPGFELKEAPLFFFKDGDKTVRLEFDNKLPYLELNRPTEIIVHIENIDLKESAIVGIGIRFIYNGNQKDHIKCSVTVTEKSVVDGHFKILVRYGYSDDGNVKFCTFLAPVKQ
jgi:hypothetical protein